MLLQLWVVGTFTLVLSLASGALWWERQLPGRLRQARTAARFEGTPAGIRHGAPQLGENTDDILLDAGLSDHEIAALRESGIVGG